MTTNYFLVCTLPLQERGRLFLILLSQNCPAEGASTSALTKSREKSSLYLLQDQPPLATKENLPVKEARVKSILSLQQHTITLNDLLQRDTQSHRSWQS